MHSASAVVSSFDVVVFSHCTFQEELSLPFEIICGVAEQSFSRDSKNRFENKEEEGNCLENKKEEFVFGEASRGKQIKYRRFFGSEHFDSAHEKAKCNNRDWCLSQSQLSIDSLKWLFL